MDMWQQHDSVVSTVALPRTLSAPYYRLIPGSLEESALVQARLARALGLELPVVDRKLCPRLDVLDAGILDEALLSERLARGLEALKVPGVRILGPLPHATPNAVAGWPLVRVEVSASAGRITGADDSAGFVRLAPGMQLDPSTGDGAPLSFSPWLGYVDRCFRHLVMTRDLLVELTRHVPDLRVQVEPLGGELPPITLASQRASLRDATPCPRLDELVRAARAELRDYSQAVRFLPADEAQEHTENLAEAGRPLLPDQRPFAACHGDRVLWLLDGKGQVSGCGLDGVRYGPELAFERWLLDQRDDLAYFANHVQAPGRSTVFAE